MTGATAGPLLGIAADGSAFAQRLRTCLQAVFADQARIVALDEAGEAIPEAAVVVAERFEAALLQDLLVRGVAPRRLVAGFDRLEDLEATTLAELGLRRVGPADAREIEEPLVVAVRDALQSLDGPADRDRVHEVLGQLALQPVGALHGLLFKRRLATRALTPPAASGLDVQEMTAGTAEPSALAFGGFAGAEVVGIHATDAGLADLDSTGRALFTQELLRLALEDDRSGIDLVEAFLRQAAARLGARDGYRPNLLLFSARLGTVKALLSRGADLWIVNRQRIPRVSVVVAEQGEVSVRSRAGLRVTRSLCLAPGDRVGLLPTLGSRASSHDERRRRREAFLLQGPLAEARPWAPLVDVAPGEHPATGVFVAWDGPGRRNPGITEER